MIKAGQSHRWYNCSASAAAGPDEVVSRPSDLALECSAAEWLLREITGSTQSALERVDRRAPNGWVITADLAAHVQLLAGVIADSSTELHVADGAIVLQEAGGVEGVRGVIAHNHNTRTMRVWSIDMRWKPYPLEERHDLAMLLSAAWKLPVGPIDEFEIVIYQPRPFHVEGPLRHLVLTMDDLAQWMNRLCYAVDMATRPNATATPGQHCLGCDHAGRCEQATQMLYAFREMVAGERLGLRVDLPGVAVMLAHAEDVLAIAEARIEALKLEAETRITAGEWMPGYTYETGLADRELTSPDAVGLAFNVDPYERKPKTPAALEREGVDPSALARFVRRPTTPAKLRRIKPGSIEKRFKRK